MIAETIHQSAEALYKVAQAPAANIAEILASTLNSFLTWPFKVGPACIAESDGNITKQFPLLVYSGVTSDSSRPPCVNANTVACAFYVTKILTMEDLRLAYEQTSIIKGLKKDHIPETGYPRNDTPLGIVFALDSDEPIEKFAAEIMRLNKTYPLSAWPDMVVVLTRGTINYAIQFEADKMGGDFVLPNITGFPVEAMYVHIFLRSLGLFSLNRMLALLSMHLQVFSPGAKLPDMATILEGVAPYGITLGGYQFNLQCQLVPVPDEMYRDRGFGLTHLPLRIEDRKGKLLSHVQFIPWQDGGVIRVIGSMPLEALLIYLGPLAKNARLIKRTDGAISNVLPIREEQFKEMLLRLQRQSNMVVRPETPKWTISKFTDEGTSSPFMARIFMGICRLRDLAFPEPNQRERFDKPYEVVLMSLLNARITAKEIEAKVSEHKRRVSAGEVARLEGEMIIISESIDKELRKRIEDFLTNAVRVLKQGMQSVTKSLDVDISFLFKQQNAFENGIGRLANTHPELALYLRESRKWSERLISSRNAVEHELWMLPRTEYKREISGIEVVEPQISGEPVSEWVRYIMDRLCCFVEEVTAYALQAKMQHGISITQLPLSERTPDCIERFQAALTLGGMPLWSITYHDSAFEET